MLLLISRGILAQEVIEHPVGEPGTLASKIQYVESENGRRAHAEVGTLLVPENRKMPTDKVVEIPFYRLKSKSKNPAPPVFLLAGGPGSSWIDNFRNDENFAEVEFYRTFADVVLFDQRGCGHARPKLVSFQSRQLPLLEPMDPNRIATCLREMSIDCRDRLIKAGIDVTAYNTEENAADLNDLRIALGYDRVTLVGGSYGSHLALTVMRLFPKSVARAMIYGVEGPDHTWDDPQGYLSTLRRIAEELEASEELASQIPEGGLLNAMQAVIDRLEEEPVEVTFRQNGKQVTVLVDAFLVRRLIGYQAGRKSRISVWPEFISNLYKGDYNKIARGAYALRRIRLDKPVHYLMDCSSGISDQRRERYENKSNEELIGDINFEYRSLGNVWGVPDLGSSFRNDFQCDIPTLIIHGTWDTSTPIENAREVDAMLQNSTLVEVVTGSHGALYNLYEHWKPARKKIASFLKGEQVSFPEKVRLNNLNFR